MKRFVAMACCVAMLLTCAVPACAEADEKPAPHADFEALYQINNHIVGWLDATPAISVPVVQFDNEYYLDHGFFGDEDAAGTVFVNKANTLWPADKHLLLHGNNSYEGCTFEPLEGIYTSLENVKADPIVRFRFADAEASTEYVPVAVIHASVKEDSEKYFNIGNIYFDSDEEFVAFAQAAQEKSMYTLPVDVQADDHLLSMMTYVHDGEEYVLLIVMCRQLRDGETAEAVTELMQSAAKK